MQARVAYLLTLPGDAIAAELEKTKEYQLLPYLAKALDLPSRSRYFTRVIGKAAADGDERTCKYIWKVMRKNLNHARISFFYGFYSQGETANHPSWFSRKFYTFELYLDGLVAGDHLELFIEAVDSWPSRINEECRHRLRWHAGAYCAKRMMIFFGFSRDNVKEYLDGCSCSPDPIPVVDFLVASIGSWTLGKYYKENLMLYGSAQQSNVLHNYFIEKDYISFREDELAMMPMDFVF